MSCIAYLRRIHHPKRLIKRVTPVCTAKYCTLNVAATKPNVTNFCKIINCSKLQIKVHYIQVYVGQKGKREEC